LKQDERWSKLLMPGLSGFRLPRSWRSAASSGVTIVDSMPVFLNTSSHQPSGINLIMAPKSRKEAEAEVRGWGFSHVFTWSDGP
jgi:hypothetical protein